MEEELLFADYIVGYKHLKVITRQTPYSATAGAPLPRLISPYRQIVQWWPLEGREGLAESERAELEGAERGWLRACVRGYTGAHFSARVREVDGTLPDESGLWAYHTIEDAREGEFAIRELLGGGVCPSGDYPVLALVRAFGAAEVYENAFRAQWMRVEALYAHPGVDPELAERIASEIGALCMAPEEMRAYERMLGTSLAGLCARGEEEVA